MYPLPAGPPQLLSCRSVGFSVILWRRCCPTYHFTAVIKNALTKDEAARGVSLAWDFMEDLGTGIDRSDPATWDSDRWSVPVNAIT